MYFSEPSQLEKPEKNESWRCSDLSPQICANLKIMFYHVQSKSWSIKPPQFRFAQNDKQIAAYHDPLMIKSMIHDPLYESSKMTKQFGSSVVGLYPILAPHDELDWLLATDTTIPMLLGFGTCFRTSSYLKHPRSIHLIPSCNQT